MDLESLGKFIAVAGLALAIVGGLFWLGGRVGLGSLPGDVKLNGAGWSCYVPIATSIVLSLLLTLVLNVLIRLFRR